MYLLFHALVFPLQNKNRKNTSISTSECVLSSLGNEVMNSDHLQVMVCKSDKLQSQFLKTYIYKPLIMTLF